MASSENGEHTPECVCQFVGSFFSSVQERDWGEAIGAVRAVGLANTAKMMERLGDAVYRQKRQRGHELFVEDLKQKLLTAEQAERFDWLERHGWPDEPLP